MDKLLRSWKAQRVTLTQAGKKQAPLRKGKSPGKQADSKKPAPITPRQRNLREMQTLVAIGKRDPERLAGVVSPVLQGGRGEGGGGKMRFWRLLWEKAEKRGTGGGRPDATADS